MTDKLTPEQHSRYALKTWGAFCGQLDDEFCADRQDLLDRMSSISWDEGLMGKFAHLTYAALADGLMLRTDAEAFIKTRGELPSYPYEFANRMAVRFNHTDGVFEVMEYNKVRGLVPRKYRPVAFYTKLMRLFYTEGVERDLKPEQISSILTEFLPKAQEYTVEVIDRATDLYYDKRFTHLTSCMIRNPRTYFYAQTGINGLVAVNPQGAVVARCIMWTDVDGRRYVDRIYYSDGAGRRALLRWCKQNNVETHVPDDAHIKVKISAKGYPYFDSINYGVRINNDVHLFVDHNVKQKFIDSLPAGTHYEGGSMSSTGGGGHDWRQPMVRFQGRYVNKADIVLNVRTKQRCLYSELPDLTPENMYTAAPTQAFKHPYENYQIVFADQVYEHMGCITLKCEDDIIINGQRMPRSSAVFLMTRNFDGTWGHEIRTYMEWLERRHTDWLRFYSHSGINEDIYFRSTYRNEEYTDLPVIISQADFAQFREEAREAFNSAV